MTIIPERNLLLLLFISHNLFTGHNEATFWRVVFICIIIVFICIIMHYYCFHKHYYCFHMHYYCFHMHYYCFHMHYYCFHMHYLFSQVPHGFLPVREVSPVITAHVLIFHACVTGFLIALKERMRYSAVSFY